MRYLILTLTIMLGCISVEAKNFVVGISLDNVLTDRWLREIEIIKSDIKEQGGETIVLAALGSQKKQNEQVKDLVDNYNIDALIIVAVDYKEAHVAVNYATKKKVRVIAYDRLITDCHLDYYITFDGIEIGQLQAKFAIDHKHGNYLLLHGPTSDLNTTQMKEGQIQVLKEQEAAGKIKIVGEVFLSKWSKREAYEMVADMYENNVNLKLDVVISDNDMIAEAVIEYFEEHNIRGVVVTGMDAELKACRRIVRGQQSMTVFGDHKALAHYTAGVATDLGKHQHLHHHLPNEQKTNNGQEDVPTMELPAIVLDQGNIIAVLEKHGTFPLEEIFK